MAGSPVEEAIGSLCQQQANLQKSVTDITQMQQELHTLIEKQHRMLEKRLNRLDSYVRPAAGDNLSAQDEEEQEPNERMSDVKTAKTEDSSKLLTVKQFTGKNNMAASPSNAGVETRRSVSGVAAPTFTARVKKAVRSAWFDLSMGGLIVINFFFLFAEMQWKSEHFSFLMGRQSDNANWDDAETFFAVVEKIFNGIFVFELGLRMWVLGCGIWKGPLEAIDSIVILATAFESFIMEPFMDDIRQARVLALLRLVRILRALRLLRFLRVLRLMAMFSALRVLVYTIAVSMDSLAWSMAVVGFIIASAGLMMQTLISDFLEDSSVSPEVKATLFEYFGSALRSTYTMFEATFSGIWASRISRFMIEELSHWFAVFWTFYTITVNFAVVRVISALFLKQTLDVARIDADRMQMAKTKEHEKTLATLRRVFAMGDQLGDGVLHKWEFQAMMENDEVMALFEELELEPPELTMLYNLLAEDDGVADQEEFLAGTMKLKNGSVGSVDMIQVMHEQTVMKRTLGVVMEGLETIDKALHPRNPWKGHHNHFEGGKEDAMPMFAGHTSTGKGLGPSDSVDDAAATAGAATD